MEARNEKAIENWLLDIESGALCLPSFQRWQVWKPQNVCRLFKTLILDEETPVGIFLVLPTKQSKPLFPPRTIIDGSKPKPDSCNALLLDGQQRLSALWHALHDTDDEECRYYVEFNDQFKINEIKIVKKDSTTDQRLEQNPTAQYKKRWFPVKLLNPLYEKETVVDDWLQQLDLKKLKLDSCDLVEKLIVDTRKIFKRQRMGGKIIPHFQLNDATSRGTAIEIYETINTNSVRLSDYYLAVAKMDGQTEKSLYDMATRLTTAIPGIKDLESDEIGELILKISCVLQDKIPSGGNYKNLCFDTILRNEKMVFSGVEWAVEKLKKLQIWHGSKLPSVVPLRVLPALHQFIRSGPELANANKVIEKYLWHAFLTDRYDKQANGRLKEDYDDLKKFLEGKFNDERKIRIFDKSDHPHPSQGDLQKVGWPRTTNRLPRSVLLVCCQGGARALADNRELTPDYHKNREQHHIFPKSKLSRQVGHSGNYVLNCLLVPGEDNREYKDDFPGNYIERLFQRLSKPLPQLDVVNRLKTHLISEDMARHLVGVTQDSIDKGEIVLRDVYDNFIESRACDVETKIKELLR